MKNKVTFPKDKVTFSKYEIIKDKDLTANQVQGSYHFSKDKYSGTLYGINTIVEANETISIAIVIQDDGSIHQIPISEVMVVMETAYISS